jgi:hypothetical protein
MPADSAGHPREAWRQWAIQEIGVRAQAADYIGVQGGTELAASEHVLLQLTHDALPAVESLCERNRLPWPS